MVQKLFLLLLAVTILSQNVICKVEEKCTEGDLLPHAENCELFHKCFEGSLYELSCPNGLHFSPTHKLCDFPQNANCAVNVDNCVDGDLLPHEESCELFYVCSEGSLNVHTCANGLHFSPTHKICDFPQNANCAVKVDTCVDGDLLSHEESCEQFYVCSEGSLNVHSCPNGLHFSPTHKLCDFPQNANCAVKVNTCVDGDLLPHEESCELFYVCSEGNLSLLSCPAGLFFNRTLKVCDFADNVNCARK